jgi:hypothetical protein
LNTERIVTEKVADRLTPTAAAVTKQAKYW